MRVCFGVRREGGKLALKLDDPLFPSQLRESGFPSGMLYTTHPGVDSLPTHPDRKLMIGVK